MQRAHAYAEERPVGVIFGGRLVVSDEQYAAGFNFSVSNAQLFMTTGVYPYPIPTLEQLPDLKFFVGNAMSPQEINNFTFFTPVFNSFITGYQFSSGPFGEGFAGTALLRGSGDSLSVSNLQWAVHGRVRVR